MKKVKSVIALVLLMSLNSFSQNKFLDYRRAVLISNVPIENQTMYYRPKGKNTFYKDAQYLHPAISLQYKTKRNNFITAELTSLTFAKNATKIVAYSDSLHFPTSTIAGYISKTINLAMRLECFKVYRKLKDKKLVPAIGCGIMPFIYHVTHLPDNSFAYSSASTSAGFNTFICPRINYYFNNHIFIDLNVPITLMTFELQNSKTNSLDIPLRNRSVTVFNFESLKTHFYPRIGVGIKI